MSKSAPELKFYELTEDIWDLEISAVRQFVNSANDRTFLFKLLPLNIDNTAISSTQVVLHLCLLRYHPVKAFSLPYLIVING